jgi:hypothetical protein
MGGASHNWLFANRPSRHAAGGAIAGSLLSRRSAVCGNETGRPFRPRRPRHRSWTMSVPTICGWSVQWIGVVPTVFIEKDRSPRGASGLVVVNSGSDGVSLTMLCSTLSTLRQRMRSPR